MKKQLPGVLKWFHWTFVCVCGGGGILKFVITAVFVRNGNGKGEIRDNRNGTVTGVFEVGFFGRFEDFEVCDFRGGSREW